MARSWWAAQVHGEAKSRSCGIILSIVIVMSVAQQSASFGFGNCVPRLQGGEVQRDGICHTLPSHFRARQTTCGSPFPPSRSPGPFSAIVLRSDIAYGGIRCLSLSGPFVARMFSHKAVVESNPVFPLALRRSSVQCFSSGPTGAFLDDEDEELDVVSRPVSSFSLPVSPSLSRRSSPSHHNTNNHQHPPTRTQLSCFLFCSVIALLSAPVRAVMERSKERERERGSEGGQQRGSEGAREPGKRKGTIVDCERGLGRRRSRMGR
eukprot:875726-Rhodomonas_salina.1